MCEWEVWAPGHPRRDTNMGGAACLSFKHTMQVIQTCRRAHGDSMRPCPRPPPQKQTGRGPGRGMFSPSVHSYLSRTLLSPTPRPSSGRRGCEGVRLRSQPSSGSKCFESKLSACVGPTHTTRAMFFLFFFKKREHTKADSRLRDSGVSCWAAASPQPGSARAEPASLALRH